MRTTVTLDKDVERLLKDKMHRDRKSFKETLNSAIRSGLIPKKKEKLSPFVVEARPLGIHPGIDYSSMHRFLDDLEVEAYLEKTRRLENE